MVNRKQRRAAKRQGNLQDPAVQGMYDDAARHLQAGRLAEAEQLFRMVLAVQPRHADTLHCLGLIAYQGSHYDESVELIGKAIRLRKDNPNYYCNLGNALLRQGRIDEAMSGYRRALALKPDLAEAHNNLGSALGGQGRIDDAMLHYARALAINPDYAEAYYNMGNLVRDQGRIDDAVMYFERALVLNPDHANAHNNLGIILNDKGRSDEAIAHFESALALNPYLVDAHNNLANILVAQGRLDDAIAHYERSITINPDQIEAHNGIANVLTSQGKFKDALVYYERALTINPHYAETHFNRSEIKTFHHDDPDLAVLEALVETDDLPDSKAPYIHFALAKAFEDTGDHVRAFEHMRQGNTLKRSHIQYDEKSTLEYFRRIATVFDSNLLDRFQGEGNPSSVPIFVLGMPRSGSTLVEQILASHPQIHAGGELTALEKAGNAVFGAIDHQIQYPESVPAFDGAILRQLGQSYLDLLPPCADDKVRIIDKLPGNFLNIGLIRLILPNARIIHTMRDPIDTCVSCYSKLFESGLEFTYDLAELGRYYRSYRGLMDHWRSVLPPGAILAVSYEDVVDDLEGQARRLIDYCGLPWDDRCLTFHETSRPVRTGSVAQVRKPLFRSSLQRWRRYEGELAPLLNELGRHHTFA